MPDSTDVLNTLHLAYTIYAVAIISLFGWLAFRLKGGGPSRPLARPIFWTYVGLLVFVGVFIHILTFNKIPWVALDLKRDNIEATQEFKIAVEKHQFIMPEERLLVRCDEVVKFDVDSRDLTYGFGLFRDDNSMVFQMQVVPGSPNVIAWRFHKNGVYDIRSTEYSGPKGAHMIVKDAVEVTGCGEDESDMAVEGGGA